MKKYEKKSMQYNYIDNIKGSVDEMAKYTATNHNLDIMTCHMVT